MIKKKNKCNCKKRICKSIDCFMGKIFIQWPSRSSSLVRRNLLLFQMCIRTEWTVIVKCGLAPFNCRRNFVPLRKSPFTESGWNHKEPDQEQGEAPLSPQVRDCVILAELRAAAEYVSRRNAKVDLSHLPLIRHARWKKYHNAHSVL